MQKAINDFIILVFVC